MMRIGKRGQSVTEYVIVISVVAAAVIGMQIFVKRGLQAKQKDVTDHFTNASGDIAGLGVNLVTVAQYEPYYTAEGSYSTVVNNNATKGAAAVREQMFEGGESARTGIDERTTRTGQSTQDVLLTNDDDWIATPR